MAYLICHAQPPYSPCMFFIFISYMYLFICLAGSWVLVTDPRYSYSPWCCCAADISQSQITWSKKHIMMQSFLGSWMTLSLSIFGMASHLHWCLNPAVLFRKSLTVTASVALMFYSCSSHFGLEHIHRRNLSLGTQNGYVILLNLTEHCGGEKYRQHCVYILLTKACAGAAPASKCKHVDLTSYFTSCR